MPTQEPPPKPLTLQRLKEIRPEIGHNSRSGRYRVTPPLPVICLHNFTFEEPTVLKGQVVHIVAVNTKIGPEGMVRLQETKNSRWWSLICFAEENGAK